MEHRASEFALEILPDRVSIGEGDNWPLTWTDTDELYASYTDGRGFDPSLETRLGSAPVVVEGKTPNISGRNIQSSSGTVVAPRGAENAKACGLIMIEGVFYCFFAKRQSNGRSSGYRLVTDALNRPRFILGAGGLGLA